MPFRSLFLTNIHNLKTNYNSLKYVYVCIWLAFILLYAEHTPIRNLATSDIINASITPTAGFTNLFRCVGKISETKQAADIDCVKEPLNIFFARSYCPRAN